MWPWSRKPSSDPADAIRATLHGDVSLSDWAGTGEGEPWHRFAAAARCHAAGDATGVVRELTSIVAMPGLESRHYLQVWHGLRNAGAPPPGDEAKHVYGVVVDVPSQAGLDTLAVYEDRRARYVNFTGKILVWEASEPTIDRLIDDVLSVGRTIANRIGPWKGERPPIPRDHARVSLLTPSGIHFGQAPRDLLFRDPMAGPLLNAAAKLLKVLVEMATKDRGGPDVKGSKPR
jgi:hypothetical protein